ncbi:protein roadkill [Nephila pilipes]|uniref:Protein roadkill n=1 Tax=Nephila pilipes TaxID=299642 RepID=A0A8X6QKF4_NEPPI|nr:protein roadkill [Nephila pilipes]
MDVTYKGGALEYILHWNIDPFCYYWIKKRESIWSPTFCTKALLKTMWKLRIMPKDDYLALYLHRVNNEGPDKIKINFHVALLEAEGSLIAERKERNIIFDKSFSIGLDSVVNQDAKIVRSSLSNSSLTARCRLWQSDKVAFETSQMFAKTIIDTHQRSFVWVIENFSNIKPGVKRVLSVQEDSGEELMTGNFSLKGRHCSEGVVLNFVLTTQKIQCLVMLRWYLVDTKGSKEEWFHSEDSLHEKDEKHLFFSTSKILDNIDLYLKNDTLSLLCEYVFSSGIKFNDIVRTISEDSSPETKTVISKSFPQLNTTNKRYEKLLLDDLVEMCRNVSLSDTKVCTSTATFNAHSAILSARSRKFREKLQGDKRKKCIEVKDLDDDILPLILLYMHTAFLKDDLPWKIVLKLYRAAKNYDIPSLFKKCSDFFHMNLTLSNVWETLLLAEKFQDKDLKTATLDFFIDHEKCIPEFKQLTQVLEKKNSKLFKEIRNRTSNK